MKGPCDNLTVPTSGSNTKRLTILQGASTWAFAFYTQGIAINEAQLLKSTTSNIRASLVRDCDVPMTVNPSPVQPTSAPAKLAILCLGLIGLISGRKGILHLKSFHRNQLDGLIY